MKVYLEKYLKEGYDIVYTGISSQMSVTFQVANLAKEELEKNRVSQDTPNYEELKEKNPDIRFEDVYNECFLIAY